MGDKVCLFKSYITTFMLVKKPKKKKGKPYHHTKQMWEKSLDNTYKEWPIEFFQLWKVRQIKGCGSNNNNNNSATTFSLGV